MDENKLPSSVKLETYTDNAENNGLPKDAYLQVTEACNSKCVMCNMWKNKEAKAGNTETLLAIVKTLKEKGFNWVTLWGGEPYLHPDIIKIMQAVKVNRMKLQLITNGTPLKGSKLDATVELADNVVFSIDAPVAEIHDAIRGVPGTFAKAVANMKVLSNLIAKKGMGPGIEIDTTIVKHNIDVLAEMITFSKQFGDVLVDYDPAQIQGTGNSEDDTIIKIQKDVVETALSALIDKAKNGTHISSPAKLELIKKYLLGEPLSGHCMSLFKDLLIAPNGNTYFCWGWDKVVGNILRKNFKSKWEKMIANNILAIDGNMDRCGKCGFSHVRWPDPEVVDTIKAANGLRKKYFESLLTS